MIHYIRRVYVVISIHRVDYVDEHTPPDLKPSWNVLDLFLRCVPSSCFLLILIMSPCRTLNESSLVAFRSYPILRHITSSYGSRSKTHARLLVSEWHLHIWMYVFAAVAKDRERAAKGSRKVWTPLFINIYVIVIVFMLGRFLAELPQDPCLGPYAASIQHFDRYLCRVM